MIALVVVDNPKHWPLTIPGTEIVAAREYLTNPHYFDLKGANVFNLSKSYRYQTVGYYVSLLARARGHRPMPSVTTLQDLRQHIERTDRSKMGRVFILEDAMSPVPAPPLDPLPPALDFPRVAEAALAGFREAGMRVVRTIDPLDA